MGFLSFRKKSKKNIKSTSTKPSVNELPELTFEEGSSNEGSDISSSSDIVQTSIANSFMRSSISDVTPTNLLNEIFNELPESIHSDCSFPGNYIMLINVFLHE